MKLRILRVDHSGNAIQLNETDRYLNDAYIWDAHGNIRYEDSSDSNYAPPNKITYEGDVYDLLSPPDNNPLDGSDVKNSKVYIWQKN